MDPRSKIPGLALLALSFTQCTGREQTADPIIGDWRAVQVDGEKHPQAHAYDEGFLIGEQLRIGDDLAGELALYQSAELDGLDYNAERVADLVVDASEAPKYRIEVAHDFFEGGKEPYDVPSYPDYGDDTGYADTGADDTGYADSGADSGALAEPGDDLAGLRPLKLPSAPQLAPEGTVFACTLEGDTLTCDREGAEEFKHWVFTRIRPEDEV
ncbi:hypothetical protein SAMN02745121_03088 [Nannocystis exedens]|uniref:Uncharacterized protein n=1 Tax=Nannocystis exedens TaxID=54 RepID=A0A1I1Y572_9BACT|nr:hypothetical protein [Nannocystis exedens]PCC71735.1 hypothetical protein NAEX_04814 [Nannocystis exedens]SFE13000.1 hypothetical protein SAMN02745121_03088 [Nannocystis exedens]